MSSSGTQQYSGLTWEGQKVQLGDIERELNRLWHDTVQAAQGRALPVRTSVLNLLVYTASDSEAASLSEITGRLLHRHPLRAIVLSAEPCQPEDSLDTSINAFCYADPRGGAQMCCEQIFVGANGEPANHLGSIVARLATPDLPMYLWWQGEPDFDSPAFQDLVRPVQKLILDSASFDASPRTLRGALELARRDRPPACAVADLNWIRLASWREVVARFFDDAALLPHLYGIKRLTLEYASDGGAGSRAQAALLAGWLFSRLGERPSEVVLAPVEKAGIEPGSLVSFCLETEHDGERARFCVDRTSEDPGHVSAHGTVGDQSLIEEKAALGSVDTSDALDQALVSASRDEEYERALEVAADVLEGDR